jgi:hypothetical protein
MIFPSLTLEKVLQVNDKTRFNGSMSFVNNSETVTDVLIKPDVSESFISVFNSDSDKWYLDWAYETDGTKDVEIRIVTDVSSKDRAYTIDVITADEDTLFSSDSDLIPYETDILRYLPKGKNSYLYAHRKAQEIIIAYLDEQRIWNRDGSRITKEDIAAVTDNEIRTQFNQWSTFQTLLIVFESIQVSNSDIFQEKKFEYQTLRDSARKRSALRLDLNKDDVLDDVPYDIRTLKMVRR